MVYLLRGLILKFKAIHKKNLLLACVLLTLHIGCTISEATEWTGVETNGQYTLTDKTIMLNSSINTSGTFSIIGNAVDRAIIDGGSKNPIFVLSDGSNITLSNLTIMNGYTNNPDITSSVIDTSKIHNFGIITLTNNIFSNNYSDYGASILSNNNENIHVNISGNKFYNNSSSSGPGVLFLNGGILDNNIFDSNSVPNNYGGAIIGENFTLKNSIFRNNTSLEGGAIYSGNVDIDNTDFVNNIASYRGGGILIGGGSISNSRFIGNSVLEDAIDTSLGGGAISLYSMYIRGSVTLNNLYFRGNTAKFGGAIINHDYDPRFDNNLNINSTAGNQTTFDGLYVIRSKDNTYYSPDLQKFYNDIDCTDPAENYSFNAESDTYQISDSIYNESGIINFNNGAEMTGKIYLNSILENKYGTVNLNNGILEIGSLGEIKNGELNLNKGIFDLANGKTDDISVETLNSTDEASIKIDVDLTKLAPVPDIITVGTDSSGTVKISDITFNGDIKEFNAQILNAQNNNIQLGLSDELKDKYNTTSTETIYSNDTLKSDVNWKDKFNNYEQVNTTTTGISLATANTTNDSIEYSTKTTEGEKEVTGLMGDTLALVNQLQTEEERNFNFDTAEDKYNVTGNLGQTSAGTLNINGVAENGNRSEINLNSNSGFELANNSTLNINNTKLTGNETLINVSNSDAVVNLQNSHIDGNISSSTEYKMNISGSENDTTIINGSAGNANATLTGSNLEFKSDTFKDGSLNTQSGSVNFQDEKITEYNIGELISDTGTDYKFDIDLSGETALADKLIVGNGSSGVINISSIDFINGTAPNKEFTVQLLDSDSDAIQLALNSEISGQNIELGTVSQTVYDTVTPTVKWNDVFNYYSQKGTNYGNIGLATTDTTNDSLALTVTNTVWEDKTYQGSMGDTLTLVNQLDTNETRNFNFDTSEDVYEVTSDLGTTSEGTLNINGALAPVPDGNNEHATINGNNHSLFRLDNETTLNMNNIKITGANNVVTGSNKDAVVNINNSEISNNAEGITTAGSINISGNSVIENNGSGISVTSDSSVITLDATDAEITLRDRLTGVAGARLNINRGTVNFEQKISALDVMMEQANVNVASDDLFDGNNMTVNSASNLNMANNAVGTMHLNNFTLNDNLNMSVDVDLANKAMDRLTADSYNLGDNNVNVSNMNLLTSTDRYKTDILFADEGLRNNVTTSISEVAYSPIYKYNVAYEKDTGNFTFTRPGVVPPTPDNPNPVPDNSYNSYNPAVMASPVASQLGGYMAMLDTYNNAFTHMDMYMLKPSTIRLAEQKENQYAITDTTGLSYKSNEMNSKGIWVKPFAAYDSVGLKNGPKVDNFSYGTFIGGDTEMFKTKGGFYGVVSPYIAYQGSHQSYAGNSIYQNGGTLGGTATFYKGNFFTGLTAGVGMNVADASTMYGSENFPMLMAGVANKTGYNFEFKDGRFIIQPNLMLSYTFVNAFDYTNGAGVKINSDPLHALQITPNVKFIMNTKNGWQPYATFGMHWNLMDETNVTANTVYLPELSVKPYFSYGLGIQRVFGERFTAYGQIMLRNGGRNGIAATFGGRYMFGHETKTDEETEEI